METQVSIKELTTGYYVCGCKEWGYQVRECGTHRIIAETDNYQEAEKIALRE